MKIKRALVLDIPDHYAQELGRGLDGLYAQAIDEIVMRGEDKAGCLGCIITLYPTLITYEDGTHGVTGVRATFEEA